MNVMNQNCKAFQGEGGKASEQPDLAEYVPGHCRGVALEVL